MHLHQAEKDELVSHRVAKDKPIEYDSLKTVDSIQRKPAGSA
jgi:hypothetical protein